MHFLRFRGLLISLFALILFGAGCVRQETTRTAPSSAPITEQAPAPTRSSPTPQPVQAPTLPTAQINCPITLGIVKLSCGIDAWLSTGAYPCTINGKVNEFGIIAPLLQVNIKPFRQFAPGLNKDQGTISEIIEGRRTAMNQTLERNSLGNIKCDRIETRAVAGLGDEALLAPLTLAGCDRVAPISDLEKAPWLWIRKGNTIAEVASFSGDRTGVQGCSSQEILEIARKYVVPAME